MSTLGQHPRPAPRHRSPQPEHVTTRQDPSSWASYAKYDAILNDVSEFGQTTATNGQKWLFVEPEEGVFNYTEGEVVSSIAARNRQTLRCHTLVWHSQLAPWVEAKQWTPETMREAIVRHIQNVAGHWKGRCYAWDVVNEALEDDGSWRKSVFYRVLGEEYIKLAFREAAKVDPHAKLYYNDYNLESPGPKVAAVGRLVKMLRDEGIRIDGVGAQAHLVAHRAPSLEKQVAAFQSFADLGVEVALTELDVRIQLPVNATNLELQKQVYVNSTAACLQVKKCVGITLWDFYDAFSWVPYVFAGEGAATLWFDDFSKHPAYDGIVEVLKKHSKCGSKRRRSRIEAKPLLH
ncbi:glycosyl hydrolase family 10 [Magnaporthiopsis poae ATCC 64411]|uniref:Beta-xylanase n=1 Tax=Magnaporthiopsis poae (strain ATCC 64411 / 73-15) TaxID=644358 RepID=A0A0C4E9T9_MAGP6|nr:glycosyl hydrolase family 10 [Magnaporthiopsis poae ATCC 64411]